MGRLIDALRQIDGAYALGLLTMKKLIGIRDPLGIRPLVLGQLDGAWILASETCALDIIGAELRARGRARRDRGHLARTASRAIKPFPPQRRASASSSTSISPAPIPSSTGACVYDVRKALGRELAREAPAGADVVVPVPDSGRAGRAGLCHQSGMPFELGIIRNHYVGRTFIEPEQRIRNLGVKLKHNPTPSLRWRASAWCSSTTASCAAPPLPRSSP